MSQNILNLAPAVDDAVIAPTATIPMSHDFKFREPLNRSLLTVLSLAGLMVLVYFLTFGLQDLAKQFHSTTLQNIADFIFYKGMMTKAVWQGEFWRPITVAFLHGGMFHLFGNVVNFCVAAFICNIAFARRGWLIIFFGASILGALVTVAISPEQQIVGASIGIMGLFGALVAAEIRKRKISKDELPSANLVPLKNLLLLLTVQLVLEHLIPNVGHVAHAAGLAIGALIGFVLPLNAGVRVYSSSDEVQVIGIKVSKTKRWVKNKNVVVSRVIDGITYNVAALNEGDAVWAEQAEHGLSSLTKCSREVLFGDATKATASVGYLVASRSAVPSIDKHVDAAEAEADADNAAPETPAKADPLWQRALSTALLVYIWIRLFQSWAPDMTMSKADLQWLHFLPSFLAEPAINIVSVLGALIVTYFAASMLNSLVGSYLIGFLAGFFKSKKVVDKSAEKSKAE